MFVITVNVCDCSKLTNVIAVRKFLHASHNIMKIMKFKEGKQETVSKF